MTTKRKNNATKETTSVVTKAPKPTIKSLQTEIEYLKKELTSANTNYVILKEDYDLLVKESFEENQQAAKAAYSWHTFDGFGFFGKLSYVLFGGNCLREKE